MTTPTKTIEKCSCDESTHLRKALRKILKRASEETDTNLLGDMIQIAYLADQGLRLEPLVGEPNP